MTTFSMIGASDEAYGVGVWIARIENLRSHFQLIADHLPEEADWLRNQVMYAAAEADRYIADATPQSASLRAIAALAEGEPHGNR